jgi:hypothetical protein
MIIASWSSSKVFIKPALSFLDLVSSESWVSAKNPASVASAK